MTMQTVLREQYYAGERALFAKQGLRIEHSRFDLGESPLKHGTNIAVLGCDFLAKYPFWHGELAKALSGSIWPALERFSMKD